MKKTKALIIFLIITYFIISIYFVFIKKDNIIYLGSSTKVKIKGDNIIITENNETSYIKKAKVYFNEEFIDGYIRSVYEDYNDSKSYQILDKNFNLLNSTDGLIAYTGKMNIKVANIEKKASVTDAEKKELEEISVENNLEGSLSDFIKVEYNLDNDKEKEVIYSYTVSNVEKTSTITIITDDEDYEVIDMQSGNPLSPGLKRSYFYKLIDFEGDNSYEIVLYQSNGDDAKGQYKIYKYINGTIVKAE